MNPEKRMNVRRNWIECLHVFASPELQRCWANEHAQIGGSFAECMCCYFDDLDLGAGLDKAIQDGWLSTNEAETVAEFHCIADAYEPPPGDDDSDVLRDPRWLEVVRTAQQAWLGLREVV